MELENGTRVPPHNLNAEKAVLGACLLNEAAIYSALEYVTPKDFYKREHQIIFDCMMELNRKSVACDLISVAEALNKNGQMDMIGGVEYLAGLTNEVPSASNAAFYGKIVSDKATQRALIVAAQKVIDDGYAGHKDALELLGDAEAVINTVGDSKLGQGYRIAERVMQDEFNKIDQIKATDGVTGIPTFRDLDYFLSGFQKGDLIVLAARPGCGKTSMALNIAANASVRYGKSVMVFSLEMPSEQLGQRILCGYAKVDQRKWRGGMLNQEEIATLSQSLEAFTDKKLFFDDTPGITIPEMRAKCRRLQAEHGLDFVVVDYLQLMRSAYRVESRQQEISEISRSLKGMAKELGVPVLALSQLSRMAEQMGDKGPQLSHLRESGAIEQDADVVLFINKKAEVDDGGDESGGRMVDVVDIIVAKNRNGPVGQDQLAFFKQYTLFADLVEEFPGD